MTSTTTAKKTAAKKTPAVKKSAAPAAAKKTTPAKKTSAAPAKKTAAKKSPAPAAAKKTTPAKRVVPTRTDAVSLHIEQVFAKLPVGAALKVSEIVAIRTKAFPTEDLRPAVTTVQGRCRDSIKLPNGVESVAKPCGLKKIG